MPDNNAEAPHMKHEIDGDSFWRAKQAKEQHAKNVRLALKAIAAVAVGLVVFFLLVKCATT